MAVLPILGTGTQVANPYQSPPFPEVIGSPQPLAATAAATTSSAPAAKAAAPAPVGFVKDNTQAAPVQTANPPPRTAVQNAAVAGYYGLQAAGQVAPTPNSEEAAVGVLGSTAAGAAMGTSVLPGWGTAIGAGVGLVMGGLNAYVGVKSARKARDKEEALRNDAIRMQKDEIARDEKWRVQNRLDTLEEARYQRKKFAMQQAYAASQAQGKNLMTLIANNAQLKQSYAKFGYN